MLKIVIVNAVYPPEPVVSAQIGRDLAELLASRGMCVTVVCPYPSRPLGIKYERVAAKGTLQIRKEGPVTVVRLPSFTAPQSGLVGRMRESFSFGRNVCRYLAGNVNDVDILYANTWPIFSQYLIARYTSHRGIPLVLHIQDVYPESFLAKLPAAINWLFASPLLWLDRKISNSASALVVLSESVRRIYVEKRKVSSKRVHVCPNWQNETHFEQRSDRNEACQRYQIEASRFTFLYLGNIGPVSGVEILVHAFHQAQIPEAQLLLIGDGSAKQACIDLTEQLGAKNIKFISDPDVRSVPLLQSMAHVCLLPLRAGVGLSSIPSKLPAYMFSAKPILATVDDVSDTARCIRDSRCGWVGEAENVIWLAEKMKEVMALPITELEDLGIRGLQYSLKNFSRREGVVRLASAVLNSKDQL